MDLGNTLKGVGVFFFFFFFFFCDNCLAKVVGEEMKTYLSCARIFLV